MLSQVVRLCDWKTWESWPTKLLFEEKGRLTGPVSYNGHARTDSKSIAWIRQVSQLHTIHERSLQLNHSYRPGSVSIDCLKPLPELGIGARRGALLVASSASASVPVSAWWRSIDLTGPLRRPLRTGLGKWRGSISGASTVRRCVGIDWHCRGCVVVQREVTICYHSWCDPRCTDMQLAIVTSKWGFWQLTKQEYKFFFRFFCWIINFLQGTISFA